MKKKNILRKLVCIALSGMIFNLSCVSAFAQEDILLVNPEYNETHIEGNETPVTSGAAAETIENKNNDKDERIEDKEQSNLGEENITEVTKETEETPGDEINVETSEQETDINSIEEDDDTLFQIIGDDEELKPEIELTNISHTENIAKIETWNIGGPNSTGYNYVTSSESEGTSDIVAILYENGIMEIKGTGSMVNWKDKDTRPWEEYSSDIIRVSIEDGIENIGGYAFMDCENLEMIEMPDSIKVIGDCAFYACEKMNISGDLPTGMEKICGRAFMNCKSLENIHKLPPNIYFAAFMGCESLTEVELNEEMTIINNQTFSGCRNLMISIIPSKITIIGEDCFLDCKSLGLEVMGDSVSTIGGNCFKGTKVNIKSLPETLKHVGDSAFEGCQGLELENLPESLVTIDPYAFKDCTGLKLKKLPDGIVRIETGSFMGCTGLEISVLPEGLEAIDIYAFKECIGLKIKEFPQGLKYIANEAFKDCEEVIISHLPSNETIVGQESFYVEYEEKAYKDEETQENYLGSSIHKAYFDASVITELNETILPDGLSENDYYPAMILNKENDEIKKARVDADGNKTSIVTIYNNEGRYKVRFYNTFDNEDGIIVHKTWTDTEGHIKPYTFTEYDPNGNKQMMGWTKEKGKYDIVDVSGISNYKFVKDTDLYTYWGTGELIYDLEIEGYFGTGFRWNYNDDREIEIAENRAYQELVFICTDKDKSGMLNNPEGSYSFDGGKTWSDKREKIIWENGNYEIVVRDYYNHAKRFTYEVNNLVEGLKEKKADISDSYAAADDSKDKIEITESITKEDVGKKNIYFNPNNGAKIIEFIAPIKGAYSIKAIGASGGTATSPIGETYEGGNGGSVEGMIYLDAGESITIKIGGKGNDVTSAVYELEGSIPDMIGGYPDGGNAHKVEFGSSQYGDMYIFENAPGGGSTSFIYKGGTIIAAAGGAGGGASMYSDRDVKYMVHDSSDNWENVVPTTENGGGGGYERGFICTTRTTSDVYAGHSFADSFYIKNPVRTSDVSTNDGGGMAEITFEGTVASTYTITFMDGDNEVAQKIYKANEQCTLPEYPIKPGFVAEGWFKLDDVDDKNDPLSFDRKKLLKEGAVVNEDITVYVLWKKNTAYVVNLPLELHMEERGGKIYETDIEVKGSVTDYNIRKDTRIKENFVSIDVEDSTTLIGKYFGEKVATKNTIEPTELSINRPDTWSNEDNAYVTTYDLNTTAHIRSERVFMTDRYNGEVSFVIGTGDIHYIIASPDSIIEDSFVITLPDETDNDKKGTAIIDIRDIDDSYGQLVAGITITDKTLKDPKIRIIKDGVDVTDDFDIRISFIKDNPVSATIKTKLHNDENGNNTYRLPAGAYKVILSGIWNSNKVTGREDAASVSFDISAKDTGFWVNVSEKTYDEASRKYTYDLEASTDITNIAIEHVINSEGNTVNGFKVHEVLKAGSGNNTVETFDVIYPENLTAGKYTITFGGMKYDFNGRTWSVGYEEDLFSIEISIRYPEGITNLTLKDVNLDKGIIKLGVTSNRDIENETVRITFDGTDVTDQFELNKNYLLGSISSISFETKKDTVGDEKPGLKEGLYRVYLGGRYKGDLYDTNIIATFNLRIQLPGNGQDTGTGVVNAKRVRILQDPIPDKWSVADSVIYFDAAKEIRGLRIKVVNNTGKEVTGSAALSGPIADNRYIVDVFADNLAVGNYTIILDALYEGNPDNWMENAYSIEVCVEEYTP